MNKAKSKGMWESGMSHVKMWLELTVDQREFYPEVRLFLGCTVREGCKPAQAGGAGGKLQGLGRRREA